MLKLRSSSFKALNQSSTTNRSSFKAEYDKELTENDNNENKTANLFSPIKNADDTNSELDRSMLNSCDKKSASAETSERLDAIEKLVGLKESATNFLSDEENKNTVSSFSSNLIKILVT